VNYLIYEHLKVVSVHRSHTAFRRFHTIVGMGTVSYHIIYNHVPCNLEKKESPRPR